MMTDGGDDNNILLREKKKRKNVKNQCWIFSRWRERDGATAPQLISKNIHAKTDLMKISPHLSPPPPPPRPLGPSPLLPSLEAGCQVLFKGVSRHTHPRWAHPLFLSPTIFPSCSDLPPVTASGKTLRTHTHTYTHSYMHALTQPIKNSF